MIILISNEKNLMDILSTIIPIILSLIAVYFTHQQLKIAKMKREDDLYDKRYMVYNKLRDFANSVMNERGQVTVHRSLLREAMLHEFLFKKDIKEFMTEAWDKYNEDIGALFIAGYLTLINGCVQSRDEEVRKRYNKTCCYFADEFPKILKDKFEVYLKIKE